MTFSVKKLSQDVQFEFKPSLGTDAKREAVYIGKCIQEDDVTLMFYRALANLCLDFSNEDTIFLEFGPS